MPFGLGACPQYSAPPMPKKADILRSALALPPDERAEVVEALQDSLRGPEHSELPEGWEPEILRRVEELQAGKAESVDGRAFLARLRAHHRSKHGA